MLDNASELNQGQQKEGPTQLKQIEITSKDAINIWMFRQKKLQEKKDTPENQDKLDRHLVYEVLETNKNESQIKLLN